jgi:hypothetical protein
MLRFSLMTTFVLVLLAALASAALAKPSQLWVQILYSGTLLALAGATIGALCGRRAFLMGLAVAGWIYFWVAGMVDDGRPNNPQLITSRFVAWSDQAMHSQAPPARIDDGREVWRIVPTIGPPPQSDGSLGQEAPAGMNREQMMRMMTGSNPTPLTASTTGASRREFRAIAHIVLTWLFGLVGGAFGVWCQRKRDATAS